MVAYKRGRSLKELLCRAKMPTRNVRRSERQAQKQGFSKCGQFCNLCPFAKSAKEHKLSGITFSINGIITCQSSGCCYRICCDQCPGWLYIGETGKKLKTRFGQHKGDILNKRDTPVADHFNLPGHGLKDVCFIGIEKVTPTDDKFLRKARESFFINRGNAVRAGANRRF